MAQNRGQNILERLKAKREVDPKQLGDFEKSLFVVKEEQSKDYEINADLTRAVFEKALRADAATTPLSNGQDVFVSPDDLESYIPGANFNKRKKIFFHKNPTLLYSETGQTEKIEEESSRSHSISSDIMNKQISNQNTSKYLMHGATNLYNGATTHHELTSERRKFSQKFKMAKIFIEN